MKNKIISICEKLFLELGFKNVTMDDIANAMGISKKTIYIHFSNKTELIEFNYPEQVKFTTAYIQSQYDAEALISIDDYLIILTKNKLKKITEIYALPKIAGKYEAKKIGSLNTQSIITGGDYDPDTKLLALTGTLIFNEYYILKIEDFDLESKKDYKIDMYEIPIGKTQVEAIKIIDSNTFWITSEDEKSSSSARLMKIKL